MFRQPEKKPFLFRQPANPALRFRLTDMLVALTMFPALGWGQFTWYSTKDPYTTPTQSFAWHRAQGRAHPAIPFLYMEPALHSTLFPGTTRIPEICAFALSGEDPEPPLFFCPSALRQTIEEAWLQKDTGTFRTLFQLLQSTPWLGSAHPLQTTIAKIYWMRRAYESQAWQTVNQIFPTIPMDVLTTELRAEIYFRTAYAWFKRHQLDSAFRYFELCATAGRTTRWYAPASFYLGYIAYLKGDLARAQVFFQRLHEHPAYSKYLPYYEAHLLFLRARETGDYSAFLTQARQCLQQPAHVAFRRTLYLLMAYAYSATEQYDSARIYLKKYVYFTGIMNPEARLWLASLFLRDGQCDSVLTYTKDILFAQDTVGHLAAYYYAYCLHTQGKRSEALTWYWRCALRKPVSHLRKPALFNYIYLATDLQQYTEAIRGVRFLLDSFQLSKYEREEINHLLPKLLLHTGNYKDALIILRHLVKERPTLEPIYVRVAYHQAMVYLSVNQPDSAQLLLNDILHYPQERTYWARALYWLGDLAYKQNNFTLARTHWTRALNHLTNKASDHPTTQPMTLYNIAYTYYQTKDYRNAAVYFGRATRQWRQRIVHQAEIPFFRDAWLRHADCYLLLKDWQKAYQIFAQYTREGPQPRDYALLQAGILAEVLHKTDQAQTHYNQLIQQYPQSTYYPEAAFRLARLYVQAQRDREALPLLRKIVHQYPKHSRHRDALAELALVHYRLNNPDSVLLYFEMLFKTYAAQRSHFQHLLPIVQKVFIAKGDPEGYFAFLQKYAGRTLSPEEEEAVLWDAILTAQQQGDCARVRRIGNQYLRQIPEPLYETDVRFYLAECYFQDKMWDSARVHYEWLTQHTNHVPYLKQSWLRTGWIALQQGDSTTAAHAYQQSLPYIEEDVLKLQVLQTLMYILPRAMDTAQLARVAHQILNHPQKTAQDAVHAYLLLAFYHYRHTQQIDSAIVYFRRAAEATYLEPGVQARYYLARIYLESGKLDQAHQSIQQVINHTPAYDYWIARAYILLGRWFAQKGNYAQARAILQSVAENYPGEDVRQEAQYWLDQLPQPPSAQATPPSEEVPLDQ